MYRDLDILKVELILRTYSVKIPLYMHELDPTLQKDLSDFDIERGRTKREIVKTLGQTGVDLLSNGQISGMEVHTEHDVHAFLRSSTDPEVVLHVQAYPGFSTLETVCIAVREMDYEKLMHIRSLALKNGGPSIGNEHFAEIRQIIPQTDIQNSPEALGEILKPYLPLPRVIVEATVREVPPRLLGK